MQSHSSSEREQNDRLLELAGGCRHEYYVAEVTESPMTGKRTYHHRMGCRKCGPHPISPFSDYAEPYQTVRYSPQRQELIEQYSCLPAVGDGHTMTLGELFHLADKLNRELWGGKATVYVCMQDGVYKASVQIQCESWDDGDAYYESDDYDTPDQALAAAILAAVDGAR
jgi:hypothetical protein